MSKEITHSKNPIWEGTDAERLLVDYPIGTEWRAYSGNWYSKIASGLTEAAWQQTKSGGAALPIGMISDFTISAFTAGTRQDIVLGNGEFAILELRDNGSTAIGALTVVKDAYDGDDADGRIAAKNGFRMRVGDVRRIRGNAQYPIQMLSFGADVSDADQTELVITVKEAV